MQPSRWHIELCSNSGVLLADLSGRAKNRRIVQSRNEAEEITWQVSLDELERYAALSHVHPNTLLVPGSTEVRIRRGQSYICGGQIVYRDPYITAASQDMQIRATGFLNMFADRFTAEERIFTATAAGTIASTLITETQADTNGDFGVTIGAIASLSTHDKTWKATQIKEALKRCAELYNFDFEFTHDKVFNIYSKLGSNRPEVIFEYPGNIRVLGAPLDATNIKNRVHVLGSGSGSEGNIKVTVDDTASQVNYKLREERLNYSDVEDTTDLTNHGNIELAAWSFPFEIPTIEVDGLLAPYVTDYGIGDYVKVKAGRYRTLESINGMYRVEKREIMIDDNDNEMVRLYLSR